MNHLVTVMAEVARVLKPAGSLWLNLGDSFSKHTKFGAPPKSMLAAPERLLLALMKDGWIVRSKVIWSKPNGLPNSVADRLNINYEVVYFLVRSPRYFFDLDAIREPHRSAAGRSESTWRMRHQHGRGLWPKAARMDCGDSVQMASPAITGQEPRIGLGDPHQGVPGQSLRHLPAGSDSPPDLGNLSGGCLHSLREAMASPGERDPDARRPEGETAKPRDQLVMRFQDRWHTFREIGDLVPCGCQAPTVPGVVLDPFMGAGTVGLVAEELRRDWLGIEISPNTGTLQSRRIEKARSGP